MPRIAWDENNRHVWVGDVGDNGGKSAVRAHFSLPEAAYVGSDLCCGCGFRSVMLQGDDWPEEWLVQEGQHDPPDSHSQNHQELYDLVVGLVPGENDFIELYGCWERTETQPCRHTENIPATRLLDPQFWFREHAIYRVYGSEIPPQ